jgi:hypothetical protein
VNISDTTRQEVRARAGFACEYCGITERDAGSELTIDHFKPKSASGADDAENLVYACFRCNLHKSDYWTESETAPQIFNPRLQSAAAHFLLAPDGVIYAISEIGDLTIARLKLNRPPLVVHRRKINKQLADREFFERTQTANKLLAQTNDQQRRVIDEQQKILEEQQRLLKIILRSGNK